MKRHLSILGLWVGMTRWDGILVCAYLAAAELLAVRLGLPGEGEYYGNFSAFVEERGLAIHFAAALAAMCVWFYFSCQNVSRLTLARLPVSERACAVWQGVCFLGWFAALCATQLGVMVVAFAWFTDALGGGVTGISLMIAAYGSTFFHWLMPLRDWRVLLCGVLVFLGLASCLAVDGLKRRMRGGFPVASLVMGGLTAMCFGRDFATVSWLGTGLCALMLGVQVYRFCRMRDTEVY